MKTAVIGAGISGLTAAYLLKNKGHEVKIFEKLSSPGGNIITENSGGYLIEHGPNSTLETTPLINVLLNSLGIINKKIYASGEAKKRYILKNGKLHPLPMSPLGFLLTGLFSASAKLKLLKEPFIKSKSNEYETIAGFTRRRLGKEFLDYAINPFVAGVFAGNPEDLNVKSAFPKLYELEQKYGSLIKGQIRSAKERKKRNEESKQSAKMFSFNNGLFEIVSSLSSELGNRLLLNTEAVSVDKNDRKYIIKYKSKGSNADEVFDSVILSVPSKITGKFIKNIDPDLSEDLIKIYYPPVAVVFTGFKKDKISFNPDGFGFLVPEAENRKILGSLWSSVIFPERAPGDSHLFTNFIGGARQPELVNLNDDELTAVVLRDLKELTGIKDAPDFIKIVRWQAAIPQYSKNHYELTMKLDKFQVDNPGLYFCSNYYKGISVCDCIKNAFELTDKM
ncbi:MAG: protoporphyrinogen oxidase [Chlorobi bacterium OLB5]|nr:MAG: protoporphyrinogen oxidase [Chlorobi bacterium OLB5]